MSLPKIILDTDKTVPIYELPLKIRQGDTGDELQVTLGKSFQKYTDLSTVDIELIAKTPDQRLIKQAVTDKSGNTFKVKFPDEMYTNVGVFRNMYFKIGDDSTSSVKLVVLQGIGSIKEAGSYIDDFETLIQEAESYVLALKDFADTGNSKIDNKVAELTGKMTDFVNQAREDLDAAKAAWNKFQNNSETDAKNQRDDFNSKFNTLMDNDKSKFKTITDNFNKIISNGKKQNATNQKDFDAAESKRENDFTSQSADFEKRYVAQGSDFKDRFKKFISTLQSDYDSFKKLLTNDVAGLNKKLTDLGKDATALQTQADKISNQLDSVDLTQMTTNKNDIASLQTQVDNSAVGTNLLLKTYEPFSMTGNNRPNQGSQVYALSRRLEKGTTVTLSFDAVSTASATFIIQNNGINGGTWAYYITDTVDTTKKHYVATTTLKGYSQQGINMRLDNVPSTTTITLSNMKLELGSNATDHSLNPKDIATNDGVQTAITNALDEADYPTSSEVDSKISTGVGQAKTYAEQSIKDIIGAAPDTLDTIAELADAVTKNKDGVQAINDGITKKADKTDVTALQNTVQAMITSISQADYDALVSAGTVDPKILYVIPDA
ncbi:phage tail protein [Companilactobacillus alimentarius]|uniref:phage tail protein n=1 Tax=Companilactobacillus alimentarius TaxID=1602 RepID=UPI0028B83AD3|nr:phage tail protein [Companilactobacillus alimentarius]MDT6951826.1 phage tail protein [Companilactobacillus alimentarius]